MIQNSDKKLFLLPLFLAVFLTLNAQEIYTSKHDSLETPDTIRKFVTVSFGLNVGYFVHTATVTGWFKGNYTSNPVASIGLSLKLNFINGFGIGTGLTRCNLHLITDKPLLLTAEAPSTIASEPNYTIDYKTSIDMYYNVFEIPLELSYQFKKIHKHIIPMIAIGTNYLTYTSPYLRENFSQNYTYEQRASGSLPISNQITPVNSSTLSFSNKTQFSPFVIASIIRPLSAHSFVKLNAKLASNEKTAVNTIYSSVDIKHSSVIKTVQFGASIEYFVVF